MGKDKKYRGKVLKINKGLIQLLIDNKAAFFQIKDKNMPVEVKTDDYVQIEINKKREIVSIKVLGKGNIKNKDKKENNKSLKQQENCDKELCFPKYLHEIYEKTQVDNYNLFLNKYTLGKLEKNELKLKIDNLEYVNFGKDRYNLIKVFVERYKSRIKSLKGDYLIEDKIFKTEYKLIIGLGNTSVYEVSMTLHHIYGIPYIPGQAIKGVLRNYVINAFFDLNEEDRLKIAKELLNKELKSLEELDKEKDRLKVYKKIAEKKEEKASGNELFEFVFGSQDKQGNIIFFDAFPDGKIKIDIDIMNNHFPEYYEDKEGKVPPADWQNPRPIKFLVVKDTPFKFFIGIKKGIDISNNLKKFGSEEQIRSTDKLLNYILELLKDALEFNGMGAKTSIGYGYLNSYRV